MSVTEEHSGPSDSIKVRSSYDVVDASGSVRFGINAGVASPVIGEEEQNVRPLWFGSGDSLVNGDRNSQHHQCQYESNSRTLPDVLTNDHSVNPLASGIRSTL